MSDQAKGPAALAKTPFIMIGKLLLALAMLAACPSIASAQLLLNVSFNPANVKPGQISTVTIQVTNNTAEVATGLNVTDDLPKVPTGMMIAKEGATANTCGGTVTAPMGGSTITLTGGTIQAATNGVAGMCWITVDVLAYPAPSGSATTYLNLIASSNVSSSIGTTSSSAAATLSVSPSSSLTGSISFARSFIRGDGPSSRMRITLENPNSFAITGTSFTNGLPKEMIKADVPNQTTTCENATLGDSATAVQLTNATIPAGGSCVIEVEIVARDPATPANKSYSNNIAPSSIRTDQNVTNASTISGSLVIQTGAEVKKTFAKTTSSPGEVNSVTVTVTNYRAIGLGPFSVTDNLPAGLIASAQSGDANYATIGSGSASTTCQGASVSISSGSVTMSGGTLPGAPTAGIGSTTCSFTFNVVPTTGGSYVNTIPSGNLTGTNYNSSSATLVTTSIRGMMSFAGATPRTGSTTLSITLYSRSESPTLVNSFLNDIAAMGAGILVGSTGEATTTCGGTLKATAGSTSISLSGGSIPAASGSTEGRCTITVPIDVGNAAPTGSRTNTVPIGGLKTDKGNNSVAFSAALNVVTAIGVSKSFSSATVVTGGQTRATITLTRARNAALITNLAFTDNLPNGFTVSEAPDATTTCEGAALTAVPGEKSFSMKGASTGTTVDAVSSCTVAVNLKGPPTTGSFTNTIGAGGVTGSTSKGPVSNVSAGSATISSIPSVTINTAFSPTNITPNQKSRLSVYIANPTAVGALTGVVLTDKLPEGLVVANMPNATLVSTSGTCTGTIEAMEGAKIVRVTGGAVSAGAACELSFDVTTATIGTLVNVMASRSLTSNEGVFNENTAAATLVSSGSSDVSITKTNGTTQQTPGKSTVYTIVVTNNSTTLSVSGLPVKDPNQSGLTTSGWTCTATSGSHCGAANGTAALDTTIDLGPEGKATFLVTMMLSSDWAGDKVSNKANVLPAAAGIADPDASNDTAEDMDDVVASADLAVTKTTSAPGALVGETVTFTVTVKNNGPSTALEAVVTDELPSGYEFVSATADKGTYASPTWTIGTIANGGQAVLTVVARARKTGERQNTAIVSSKTGDPDMTNNTASIKPNIVGLTLAKSVETFSDPVNGTTNPKAIPGAVMLYRVTVSNATDGTVDADTIEVSDVLPGQVMAFVSSGSVTITQGSIPGGLTVSETDIFWTTQPGGGAPHTYTPKPDQSGYDPAITGIRIRTRGSMAAGTADSPSTSTLTFRVRIR